MYVYQAPLGGILLVGDGNKLTNLYFSENINTSFIAKPVTKQLSYLDKATQWLDLYFAGKCPDNLVMNPVGSHFCRQVWKIVSEIPYGVVVSYGYLAARVAGVMNLPKMSAQAVGHALGKNPLPIFIPCHRVVGSDGNLNGYSGGLHIKRRLLTLERAYCNGLKGYISDAAMEKLNAELC